MIDDFCLSADGSMIFGADFLNSTIISWKTDGSPTGTKSSVHIHSFLDHPILAKIGQPTSVRLGVGPNFQENDLFVTQGGGLIPSITSKRIVQFKNPYKQN